MVVEIQNVPDHVIEVLTNCVFKIEDLKSPLDHSLRASLMKELRRRRGTVVTVAPQREFAVSTGKQYMFMAYVPDLRPLESLAAAYSLVDKTLKADRAALGAFVSGDRPAYEALVSCVVFLTEISLKLAEQTHRSCAREKRKWN